MKAKVIRSDMQISPSFAHCVDEWAEFLDWIEILENGSMVRRPFWKVGTILDPAVQGSGVADCWKLVQQGCCEAADDECDAKSGRMNAMQVAQSQHAYERQNLGIDHEDFAAYDAGEMTGYNPDGSWIKGPNWKEPEDEPEDEEDE